MEGDGTGTGTVIAKWSSDPVVLGVSVLLGAGLLGTVWAYSSTRTSASTRTTTTTTASSKKGKGGGKGTLSSMLSGKQSVSSSSSSSSSNDSNADLEMKGYKTNSRGQKTTYFNRELSEEEKRLIGDITPKKIEPGAPAQSFAPQRVASPAGASAWNQAGTWEEKNVTDWAVENLTQQLRLTDVVLPADQAGKVSVTSVQKVDGDATVSMIRGKKKYLYDLNTSVRWKLEADGIEVTGDLLINEISADATHEFNVQSIVIVNPPAGQNRKKATDYLNKFVHNDSGSLKTAVTSTLQCFYEEMKTKF